MVLGKKKPANTCVDEVPTAAGKPKPSGTVSEPPAPAQSTVATTVAHELFYAKATFEGFRGTKEIIFIPDNMKWTTRVVDQMLNALGMKRPNLVLKCQSPALMWRDLLSDDELQRPELQQLCEQDAAVEDRNSVIKQIVAQKMQGIIAAVMASLDQTKSAAWLGTDCHIVAQAIVEIDKTIGITSKILTAKHSCEQSIIRGKETHEMMSQLFAASVPMNEVSVAAARPLSVDMKWLVEAMMEKNGHTASGNFWVDDDGEAKPENERHPGSQWWGGGDIYFIGFRPIQGGGMDLNCVVKNIQIDPSLLAPCGQIDIGGKAIGRSTSIIDALEQGLPLLLLRHSGGITGIWAEIVTAIVQVIRDVPGWQEKFAKGIPGANLAHVAGRILAVSQSKVLDNALAATCTKREDCIITLPDVSRILDLAQSRHQLFLQTVRVLDPLVHTPEQALEELSACFSSTYVGLQEFGATTAQKDVVVKAWNIHKKMEDKASSLRRYDLALAYLGAFLAWVAIVSASSLDLGRSCADDSIEGGLRFCTILGRKSTQKMLEISTIVVPAGASLVATMAARFQMRMKWGQAKLAAAQIVRHIYLFRGGVDIYDVSNQGDEEEEISRGAAAKLARLRFVTKISDIQIKTHAFDSMDMDGRAMLSPLEIPAHLQKTLYGMKPSSMSAKQKSADLPESARLLEEGDIISSEDADDGINVTTAELYHKHRAMQLLNSYHGLMPGLSRKNDGIRLLIFLLGFFASMLGATHNSSWIPAVIGFTSMMEVLIVCHNMVARSAAMNCAIAVLDNMDLEWSGLSNMDRRTPKFKKFIMTQTEQLALSVIQAWVGQMGTTTDKMDDEQRSQGKDSGEKGGDKKKKENKSA